LTHATNSHYYYKFYSLAFQGYQTQILEIRTSLSKIRRKINRFLFETTEPPDGFFPQRRVKFLLTLELFSCTEQVDDENVC